MGESAQRLTVHQDTELLVLTNDLHLKVRGKVTSTDLTHTGLPMEHIRISVSQMYLLLDTNVP